MAAEPPVDHKFET